MFHTLELKCNNMIRKEILKTRSKYKKCNGCSPQAFISQLRLEYIELIDELLYKRHFDLSSMSDPLCTNRDSEWNTFFKDSHLLKLIRNDSLRLNSDDSFFYSQTPYPLKSKTNDTNYYNKYVDMLEQNKIKIESFTYLNFEYSYNITCKDLPVLETGFPEMHYHAIERILFLYLKQNSDRPYKQYMIYIIATIYRVLFNEQDTVDKSYSEMDSYYFFNILMEELENKFGEIEKCKSDLGLGSMVNSFLINLEKCDKELYILLVRHDIDILTFLKIWLPSLFSTKLDYKDIISTWYIMLKSHNKLDFALFFTISMIIIIKDKIMYADPDTITDILFMYPLENVSIRNIQDLAINLYLKARDTST